MLEETFLLRNGSKLLHCLKENSFKTVHGGSGLQSQYSGAYKRNTAEFKTNLGYIARLCLFNYYNKTTKELFIHRLVISVIEAEAGRLHVQGQPEPLS